MSLDQAVMQPTIKTEHFTLRPLRKSDEGLIEHYASDLRVAGMTSTIPHPLPPGATEAFVTRSMANEGDEYVWAVDGTADGGPELKGVVSLKRMDRSQSEIGFWIAPVFWNTGIASASVRALIEANPFGDSAIFASVFQDNPASARVLTQCGFEYLGDAETFSVARDANVPTWTYSRKL